MPVIGFIAHVDTSPEMSGAGVKPIVHRDYDGRDLVLPDDPDGRAARGRLAVSRRVPRPRHRHRLGHDAARRRQQERRGRDHDRGRIPDGASRDPARRRSASRSRPTRRSGRAPKHFDVARFGARYAYTMDGGAARRAGVRELLGRRDHASPSAASTRIPGYAKGRMVNAIKLAARFIDRLPADRLSPETTDGREGFVHPYVGAGRRGPHGGEAAWCATSTPPGCRRRRRGCERSPRRSSPACRARPSTSGRGVSTATCAR